MATVTLYPSKDSYVHDQYPTTNFGTANNMYAGDQDEIKPGTCRAWMQFDLSSITAGSTINSATLNYGYYGHGGSYIDVTYGIAVCNDNSWTETGITWNNAPNGSVSGISNTYASSSGSQFSALSGQTLDMTSDVDTALASGAVSWRIINNNEGDGSFLKTYSKEGSAHFVSLVVNYTAPTGAPPGAFLMFM